MNWIEISVRCDGEGAEAVAELFNRLNSRPGEEDTAAVIEVGGYDPVGELTDARGHRAHLRGSQRRRERGARAADRGGPLVSQPAVPDAGAGSARAGRAGLGQRLEGELLSPAGRPAADHCAGLDGGGDRSGAGAAAGDLWTRAWPSAPGCTPAPVSAWRRWKSCVHPGDAVLDVGCGSGVLSIAAVRLGAASVLATDIDPIAVQATEENCQRNGVADQVLARVGSLPARDERPEGWPVIVANILAEVIAGLLDEGLGDLLADDGKLILSGIIEPARRAGDGGAGSPRLAGGGAVAGRRLGCAGRCTACLGLKPAIAGAAGGYPLRSASGCYAKPSGYNVEGLSGLDRSPERAFTL